jgi:acylphosphatase
MIGLRCRFFGRVQGVGFRYSVYHTCCRNAVRGWVRNEPDGSVHAELHGPEESVERALEQLAKARRGFIQRVVRSETAFDSDWLDFEIKR